MSEETKHTKGPWEVGYNEDFEIITINTCLPLGETVGMLWTVANITNASPTSSKAEIDANAALIASAPDMAKRIEELEGKSTTQNELALHWKSKCEERGKSLDVFEGRINSLTAQVKQSREILQDILNGEVFSVEFFTRLRTALKNTEPKV